jgi:hypothetical protein
MDDWYIGKDQKGSLIDVLSWHLKEGTEERHGNVPVRITSFLAEIRK